MSSAQMMADERLLVRFDSIKNDSKHEIATQTSKGIYYTRWSCNLLTYIFVCFDLRKTVLWCTCTVRKYPGRINLTIISRFI